MMTISKRARKVKRRNWKVTRRGTRRTMPTPTLRCNFCLLIIHAFLERAQPASGVQTAVRRLPGGLRTQSGPGLRVGPCPRHSPVPGRGRPKCMVSLSLWFSFLCLT